MNNCKCASELYEDKVLDKVMDRNEIAQRLKKVKNNKTGGRDGLVGELLNYVWWQRYGTFIKTSHE